MEHLRGILRYSKIVGDLVRVGGWPMMAEGGGSNSAGAIPFSGEI